MTSTVFSDLYNAATSGDEGGFERQVVPAGTYDVIVEGARPYSGGKSPMIFLTLGVLNGPLAGKKSDVNITFSDSPNARPYFVRKTKGLVAYPDVLQALQTASSLDDTDSGLALIAESFKGKALKAEISVAGSDAGSYAGTNNLDRTEASVNPTAGATSVAAPAQQTAPAQAPASNNPPAAQPFNGRGGGASAPQVTVPF